MARIARLSSALGYGRPGELQPRTKICFRHQRHVLIEMRREERMLDGVSLDQLRTFIAAADEGSFSAAGRRLRRAQSVVSHTLANLEGQLGVKLFDRSARRV